MLHAYRVVNQRKVKQAKSLANSTSYVQNQLSGQHQVTVPSQSNTTIESSNQPAPTRSLKTLLTTINDNFLSQHHAAAKKSALRSIDTVMVYLSGVLSLWKKTANTFINIENKQIVSDEYQEKKQLAHIPIYIQTILQNHELTPLEKQNLFMQLEETLIEIKTRFHEFISKSDDIEAFKNIIDRSLLFINTLIKGDLADSIIAGELQSYMQQVKNALAVLSEDATKVQLITHLDVTVMQWIHAHQIDMNNNRVLVVGTHGPRKKLIEMQYFNDLYNGQAIDDKVYYIEILPKFFGQIDTLHDLIEEFLGPAELNKSYGKSLESNSKFMFRDVLGKYGPPALSELKENHKHCPVGIVRF